MSSRRFRLLALDVDGTLLDPYGDLHAGVVRAVAAARRRGLQVVLCTGRRFRTALPIARALSLEGSIVVNNGVLVKEIDSGETVHHRYLETEVYPEVVNLLRETGPPLVYVDTYHEATDLLTERRDAAHPFQSEYLDDHAEHCHVVDDLAAVQRDDVIMVSLMGDDATLASLRERALGVFGERVHTHSLINKNYRGAILEFLSPASGKWSALARLAEEAGISPAEIAAVGDDTNDAEMLRAAGLGIAMGNAVEETKEAADVVVRSNAEGGAIAAIERVLLES